MIKVCNRKLNLVTTSIFLSLCGTALIGCNNGGTNLPAPTPAEAKIIFVTTNDYSGNLNGVAGADAICESEAYQQGSMIGTGNVFKALLVSSTRYPCDSSGVCGPSGWSDWPLAANTGYRTVGTGWAMWTSNANGIFESNGIYTDITRATSFLSSSPTYWSGINGILVGESVGAASIVTGWSFANESNNWNNSGSLWSQYVDQTCHDWSESSGSLSGSLGGNDYYVESATYSTVGLSVNAGYSTLAADSTIPSGMNISRWVTGSTQTCSQKRPLVCVQQ